MAKFQVFFFLGGGGGGIPAWKAAPPIETCKSCQITIDWSTEKSISNLFAFPDLTLLTFTCSKSIIETLEKGAKYVQC